MATPTDGLAALGKLTDSQREGAMHRFAVLQPYLEDGVPLARAAAEAGITCRTAVRGRRLGVHQHRHREQIAQRNCRSR
ncbi:hypothetical protein [Streptomyces chartreusis]|uniref:hypothetical protein n=1 Tax=Streptomyces chartreusis TaxID=1969 RepID=UPI003D9315E8